MNTAQFPRFPAVLDYTREELDRARRVMDLTDLRAERRGVRLSESDLARIYDYALDWHPDCLEQRAESPRRRPLGIDRRGKFGDALSVEIARAA